MNFSFIRYILGRLLMVLGLLMLPSVIIGLLFQNDSRVLFAFLWSILFCELIGYGLSYKPPTSTLFFAKEGLALVGLAWAIFSIFGAFPFYLSGFVPNYVDALFESVSGFTTTGASVLSQSLTALPEGLLFWRSFTLMVGGMGMLVFILYIIPNFGVKGVYIMRAELPGPIFGKVESRVSQSILILYAIYIMMTLVLAIFLVIGGVPLFESILLAMGASGTGGFNIHPDSIAYYNSYYVKIIMSIALFVFGMNFNFFYLIAIGKWRAVLKSEELKWYCAITGGAVLLISLLIIPQYATILGAVQDALFNVFSVSSTTAYSTTDLNVWPAATHVILLFLMFTGAMSGSTTSGLKIVRVSLYIKIIRQEMRRMLSPNRVTPVTFDGNPLDEKTLRSIIYYIFTYLGVFIVIMLLISLDTVNFASAFNATIATLSNIGGSLDLLGPAEDYAFLGVGTKLVMCVSMIMGRLEIYPILILLFPSTWRRV